MQNDWESLFNKCTPAEREEILFHMLSFVEARESKSQKETIDLCRENPKHLETLPASKLRQIAGMVSEDAHSLIVSTHPDTADILLALEGLTAFSVSADEPTLAEMRDTITDIQAVWIAAGGHYESELLKPEFMLIASREQKQEGGTDDK